MDKDRAEGAARMEPETKQEVVAGIVLHRGRVLVAQRKRGQIFAGLWEFPGGKVEAEELPEAALSREFQEELGATAVPGAEYHRVRYRNPAGVNVDVRFYLAELQAGQARAKDVSAVAWVEIERLAEVDFIPADQAVATRLVADWRDGRL